MVQKHVFMIEEALLQLLQPNVNKCCCCYNRCSASSAISHIFPNAPLPLWSQTMASCIATLLLSWTSLCPCQPWLHLVSAVRLCAHFCYVLPSCISPWYHYHHTGWLGVKHQFTYLLLSCVWLHGSLCYLLVGFVCVHISVFYLLVSLVCLHASWHLKSWILGVKCKWLHSSVLFVTHPSSLSLFPFSLPPSPTPSLFLL